MQNCGITLSLIMFNYGYSLRVTFLNEPSEPLLNLAIDCKGPFTLAIVAVISTF